MELEGRAKELVEELKKLPEEMRFAVINASVDAPRITQMPPHAGGEGVESYLESLETGPKGASPGAQYVPMGVPDACPVLRPLRQPIFDKLILEPNGEPSGEVELFTASVFPNGVSKQPGIDYFHPASRRGFEKEFVCMGHPAEFDFRWLELHVVEFLSHADVRAVLQALKLEFIFGQATPWLTLTADSWTPLLSSPPEDDKQVQRATPEQIAAVMKGLGENGAWPHYFHDFRSPEGNPRRISSTEAFRMKATWHNLPTLKGRVVLKVMMQDTYYAPL